MVRLLWDLLPKARRDPPMERRVPEPEAKPEPKPSVRSRSIGPAAERYERMTKQMLADHGVRVRKWRSSMSGVAWQVTYKDGSVSRLIESPKPKGPMSAAVFLHEIGHHAIGFNVYKPRCLEEYHAWRYSLEQMEFWGVSVTDRVQKRVHDSLHYAIYKARRRGLKRLPTELTPFLTPVGDGLPSLPVLSGVRDGTQSAESRDSALRA